MLIQIGCLSYSQHVPIPAGGENGQESGISLCTEYFPGFVVSSPLFILNMCWATALKVTVLVCVSLCHSAVYLLIHLLNSLNYE